LTNDVGEHASIEPHFQETGDADLTASGAVPREASCSCATGTMGRRMLLAASLGLGVGLEAGASGAQSDPTHDRPKPGDVLVKADDATPLPLTPDSLALGAGQVMAWPMDLAGNIVRDGSRLNKVLVLRLDPAGLDSQTAERAAGGVLAYSAICPHTGCEVVNWLADKQVLDCPCHNSEYDPKAGARVISGPSPRGLAALPLRITDDGKLSVARPFIGRLGIQQT
jgi:rieske iron-sulfur protein